MRSANGSAERATVRVVGPRTAVMNHVVRMLRERGGSTVEYPANGIPKTPSGNGQPALGGDPDDGADGRLRGQEVYLLNCLRPDGTSSPRDVTRMVSGVRDRVPDASIITLIDETDSAALRAARHAGATDFLGRHEAGNEEAVSWRVLEVRGTVQPSPRPSDAEVAAARARVDEAVAKLPSPAARQERVDSMCVDAPRLRDPRSGRFDAKRIAAALGISRARLARGVGVSQQALSAKPDSPRAQAGLLPVARVLAGLDELLPADQQRMWLNTPRESFSGSTPLAWMEQGNAAAVARTVEAALEGDPG
jgi:hypothetical protein